MPAPRASPTRPGNRTSIPPKLPQKDFLKHYATRLNAVEINYTFRQLPSASTLENWVKATPEGFVFALKAHMRITHILRLKESEFTRSSSAPSIRLRVTRRLGPVLFQLPPNFKADIRDARGVSRKASRRTSAAPSSSATVLASGGGLRAAGEARGRAVPGRIGEVRGAGGADRAIRLRRACASPSTQPKTAPKSPSERAAYWMAAATCTPSSSTRKPRPARYTLRNCCGRSPCDCVAQTVALRRLRFRTEEKAD